jgi:hypothetical protein
MVLNEDGTSIFQITKAEDFAPFCNSPCSQVEHISILPTQNTSERYLILSLRPLKNIIKIQVLNIRRTHLTHVDDLSKLRIIDGAISIENNPFLKNLEGLSNAEIRVRSVFVESNRDLKSLVGLRNIVDKEPEKNSFDMRLTNNPSLESLEGLRGPSTMRSFTLQEVRSERLESLKGLEWLESVEGLQVRQIQGLKTLDGLQNVRVISDRLVVGGNLNLPFCHIERLLGQLEVQPMFVPDRFDGRNGALVPDDSPRARCQP